jgi:putative radical SAM enzyme (TIGR03279 family)
MGTSLTLTNLTEDDWQKILKMRLSPLYVSIHSMQDEIRDYMLNSPHPGHIKQDLQRLQGAGIEVHTQIVLCPGINDGDSLIGTIKELARFFPSVASVGIVPVGLTAYRQNLPELKPVSASQARELVESVGLFQQRFRRKLGVGFVYLADEFYLRAGIDVPASEYYDDYAQIENGIGLSRILLDDFERIEPSFPLKVGKRDVYLITGLSGVPVMQSIVDRLNRIKGLHTALIPVKNHYFGEQVTVTGLLTGQDIIRTLGQKYRNKKVLIPEVVFKEGCNVLLDDVDLDTIIKKPGLAWW